MSKLSNTNYPNGFLTSILYLISLRCQDLLSVADETYYTAWINSSKVLLGGFSSEVPPLPIPNREVKLTHADGTAVFPWESR